ncbi:type-2 ice-structuring protein-like isoform X2 [Perca flavescens]|uniref:type-2 ice-structuring protein-like isoform X2 n=1 Tax=Perca flavescens TaxID=8167 RepID=UPI00106E77A4|nr:type-2 ice-structuring protein-like isoform X2 [Perca flavescens]
MPTVHSQVAFINFSMKMLAVSVLVAAMMALTTGEDHVVKRSTHCENGWSLYGGRCFRYFPGSTSWAVAERSCRSSHAHLASVHNRDEEHWIQRLAGLNLAWIGGSDAQQEGFWFWSDGTPFNYVNWCGGEPNNDRGQHCLQINYTDHKCWDDDNCNVGRGFVCVKKQG